MKPLKTILLRKLKVFVQEVDLNKQIKKIVSM